MMQPQRRPFPSMVLPMALRITLRITLAGGLLACSAGTDRERPPDSTGLLTEQSDSLAGPARRASDASMVISVTEGFREGLRAVTDSFAAREAVRVVLESPGTGGAESPADAGSGADLIVVSGTMLARLPGDSASWTLPFAELVQDSVGQAVADSAGRGDSLPVRARPTRRRRLVGRAADSARADSARRALVRQDSIRAAQERARSDRTLVLTIPAGAPNHGVAERFVRYMLTEGRVTLLQSGVLVIPRLVVRGSDAPPAIRALVDTVIGRDSVAGADSASRR